MNDGQVKIGVDVDDSHLDADLGRVQSKLQKSAGKLRDIMQGPVAAIGMATQAIEGFGAAFFDATVGNASKMENFIAAFTPLTGSAENAKDMIAALNKEAATTPFELENIAGVAKQLLPSLGNDVDAVTKTFRMLGDTAGGSAEKLDSIARGYTKVLNTGKVSMEALNMIADAGVPIQTQLAQSMGITTEKMYELSSQGKITADDLTKAFEDMTKEGGIFFDGMNLASKTFSGNVSTMNDNLKMAGAELGEVMLPLATDFVKVVSGIAQAFVTWASEGENLPRTLKLIGESAAIAVVALTAYMAIMHGSAVVQSFAVAIKALTVAMATNPIGLIAVGIAGVLIALNAVADALGGWPVLWLYIQKYALTALDLILKGASAMANGFIDQLNFMAKGVNMLLTALGQKPLRLFDKVDLSTGLGVTKTLQNIDAEIKATDRAAQDAAKKREAERIAADKAAKQAADNAKKEGQAVSFVVEKTEEQAELEKYIAESNAKRDNEYLREQLEIMDAQVASFEDQKEVVTELTGSWQTMVAQVALGAKASTDNIKDMAVGAALALGSAFSDMSDALASGADGWKAFAKSALSSLAAIVDAMGNELAIMAAKAAVTMNWPQAALAGAGAAAAYGAAAGIRAGANSFAVGTLGVNGDQMAMIHDREMIIPAGISQEARQSGIFIGPPEMAPGGGSRGGTVSLDSATIKAIASAISVGGSGSRAMQLIVDGRLIAQSTVDWINAGQVRLKA